MTISSTTTKVVYAGNGSTTAFAVPFMFIHNADLEITLTDSDGAEDVLTISTDYSLEGAGDQAGGTCSLSTAPAEGETLTIRRDPEIIQEVDYVENDAFPAATHEAALDKLTMICQALAERLDRTISFRVSSAVTGVEVPEPEAGRALIWNEGGENLRNGPNGDEISNAQGYATTASAAKTGAETALAAARAAQVAAETAQDGAEGILSEALKADTPSLLRAVYGDDAQIHTGADTHGLVINRNHIIWSLTVGSGLSYDITFPYAGAYVFHVYPNGYSFALSAAFKKTENLPDPDPAAGEIRIVVERFNSRLSIISLQNIEA